MAKTTRTDKCRVPGCSNDKLRKKRGMCAMHDQRFLRTGRVGPARSFRAGPPKAERGSRAKDAARVLRWFVDRYGATGIVVSPGKPGLYRVSAKRGRAKGILPIARVRALERRGWLVLDGADGDARSARLSVAGRRAAAGVPPARSKRSA